MFSGEEVEVSVDECECAAEVLFDRSEFDRQLVSLSGDLVQLHLDTGRRQFAAGGKVDALYVCRRRDPGHLGRSSRRTRPPLPPVARMRIMRLMTRSSRRQRPHQIVPLR